MDIELPTRVTFNGSTSTVACITPTNVKYQFTVYVNKETTVGRPYTFITMYLYNTKWLMSSFSSTGTSTSSLPANGCLRQGDLVYRPELKEVWFPALSILVCATIFFLAFRLILKHWWRRV